MSPSFLYPLNFHRTETEYIPENVFDVSAKIMTMKLEEINSVYVEAERCHKHHKGRECIGQGRLRNAEHCWHGQYG